MREPDHTPPPTQPHFYKSHNISKQHTTNPRTRSKTVSPTARASRSVHATLTVSPTRGTHPHPTNTVVADVSPSPQVRVVRTRSHHMIIIISICIHASYPSGTRASRGNGTSEHERKPLHVRRALVEAAWCKVGEWVRGTYEMSTGAGMRGPDESGFFCVLR